MDYVSYIFLPALPTFLLVFLRYYLKACMTMKPTSWHWTTTFDWMIVTTQLFPLFQNYHYPFLYAVKSHSEYQFQSHWYFLHFYSMTGFGHYITTHSKTQIDLNALKGTLRWFLENWRIWMGLRIYKMWGTYWLA